MRFREKLGRFMYGRYGTDKLNTALMVLFFIIIVINAFIHSFIIQLIAVAVCGVIIYRTLSKKTVKRQAENQKFMILYDMARPYFSRLFRRIKDIKTHRYRTCKNCKTVLRLPRARGKHAVVCPNCKHKFKVRIWF